MLELQAVIDFAKPDTTHDDDTNGNKVRMEYLTENFTQDKKRHFPKNGNENLCQFMAEVLEESLR